jgi:hypothetical protein
VPQIPRGQQPRFAFFAASYITGILRSISATERIAGNCEHSRHDVRAAHPTLIELRVRDNFARKRSFGV